MGWLLLFGFLWSSCVNIVRGAEDLKRLEEVFFFDDLGKCNRYVGIEFRVDIEKTLD